MSSKIGLNTFQVELAFLDAFLLVQVSANAGVRLVVFAGIAKMYALATVEVQNTGALYLQEVALYGVDPGQYR